MKTDRRKQLAALAAASGAVALLWLAALPWLAARPQMKSHLDWLDEQKIDPSAMYYTELEVMDDILHRRRIRCADHVKP